MKFNPPSKTPESKMLSGALNDREDLEVKVA